MHTARCCRSRSASWLEWSLAFALYVNIASASCIGEPPAVANVAWSCNGTADQAVCTGTCDPGYASALPGPTSLCNSGAWETPTGSCQKVAACQGMPAASLLDANAQWPEACADRTPFGSRCTAQCLNGAQGSPSIMCGGSEWDTSTFRGKCIQGQVCLGRPTAKLPNGRLVRGCYDAAAGSSCPVLCSNGYGGPFEPHVACVADSSSASGATWATTVNGSCSKLCASPPPESLLHGAGTWPSSCDGRVPEGQNCEAVCSSYGSARITCGSSGWMLDSFVGGCSTTPVCPGVPASISSKCPFPKSCAMTAVGTNCTAQCEEGYGGADPPRVACLPDPQSASLASWAPTVTGTCNKVCEGSPPASLLNGAGTWPSSCAGKTHVKGCCEAVCSFYGSARITCGSNGWMLDSFVGGCSTIPESGAVCPGAPPANLLTDGSWPTSCRDRTPVGGSCTAQCTYSGSATIQCAASGWEVSSFEGQCDPPGEGCSGTPPAVANGRFPASCANTAVGGTCTATCDAGYGSTGQPVSTCRLDAGASAPAWSAPVPAACVKNPPAVCSGTPPAVANGRFPASCANTAVGGTCTATCDAGYGSTGQPVSTCRLNAGVPAWSAPVPAACAKNPPAVCSGTPPAVANGRFPASCANTAVGGKCTATCDAGYGSTGQPVSTCVLNAGASAPAWSAPVPAACVKNADGSLAVLVSEENNAVILCRVQGRELSDCVASTAAVGLTANQPLFGPLGVAIEGDKMWISDRTGMNQGRVRVCTWEGQQIKFCNSTYIPFAGAGAVVVDTARDLLFHILNMDSCVMTCNSVFTLDKECSCIDVPDLSDTTKYPSGLALAYGDLWIASLAGITRCPLTADAFDWERCATTVLNDEAGELFQPSSILVDTAGAGTTYMTDGFGSALVCTAEFKNCIRSKGDGTFAGAGPAFTGLALSGGLLYIPLLAPNSSNIPAISVCSNLATITGCSLSKYSITPPQVFTSTVTVTIVPAAPAKRKVRMPEVTVVP